MVLRGHKALCPPQRSQWLRRGEQRSCRQGPGHRRLLSTPSILPAGPVAPGAGGGLGVTALSGTDLGWGGRERNWREPQGAGVGEGLGLAFQPLTLIGNVNTVQLALQPAACSPLLSLPLYSSLQLREDLREEGDSPNRGTRGAKGSALLHRQ